MPLSDDDQTCLDFRIQTTPQTAVFARDTPFGRVHYFDLRAPHEELTVEAESLVVTHRHDPFEGLQLLEDDIGFYKTDDVQQRYCEYMVPTERVQFHPETARIAAAAIRQSGPGAASFLVTLNRLLHRVLSYAPGTTNVNTSILQVLEHKSGVCQDFAHLMLAVCRQQGIPARYVSGYLYTRRQGAGSDADKEIDALTEVSPLDQVNSEAPRTTATDDDAMHAWVECLLPDDNWHGFDPTNNLLTDSHYIKVHYGRDYGDVPPLRGVFRGPLAEHLIVNVTVREA